MDIRNFFRQTPAQPSGTGEEPAEMTPAAEPRAHDAPVSGAEPRAATGVVEGEGEGTGLNADNAATPDPTVSPAATTSGSRLHGAVDAELVPMEIETTAPLNGLAKGLPMSASALCDRAPKRQKIHGETFHCVLYTRTEQHRTAHSHAHRPHCCGIAHSVPVAKLSCLRSLQMSPRASWTTSHVRENVPRF